jgi:ATP-binding cassette subfamily C (CFTR/MRP) protein 1
VEDLNALPLPKDCETKVVYEHFSKCWEEELKKAQSCNATRGTIEGDRTDDSKDDETNTLEMEILSSIQSPQHLKHPPSLIRALYRAFGADFLRAGLYKLVHDSNLFVGPLVLNKLIQFLRNDSATLSEGLSLVAIVTFSQIVMSITLRHYFYKCYTCGLRIRTAVVIAIYEKSLLLSLKERHQRGGAGEIANLVGIDAQRMQDLMTYLHAAWYSFFQIGLAMYFLQKQVGWAMLAGVAVILLLIPSTKAVAAYLGGIQQKLMKARDERVALNNEMLGSMKIIKIQAWEENFRKKLLGLRHVELESLKHYFFTSAVSGESTI